MSLRNVVTRIVLPAFVLAWFLPATREMGPGEHHLPPMSGWMAFYSAVMGLYPRNSALSPPLALLGGFSALTNVVMVIVLAATVRGAEIRSRWAWWLIAAGILNAWWLVEYPASLGIGYYVWWLSFFVTGGAMLASRRAPARPPGEGPAD